MATLILALDSSAEHCALALGRLEASSEEWWEKNGAWTGSHSEEIGGLVEGLFNTAGVMGAEINLLIVGSGPGSFTGLRIGYAFMKGLSLAWRVPLVKISTFAAYAFEFRRLAKLVVSLADARRNEFFYALYLNAGRAESKLLEGPGIVGLGALKGKIRSRMRELGILEEEVLLASYASPAGWPWAWRRPEHAARNLVERHLNQAPLQARSSLLMDKSPHAVFDLAQLSSLEPDYVRAVAAKTIAERKGAEGKI